MICRHKYQTRDTIQLMPRCRPNQLVSAAANCSFEMHLIFNVRELETFQAFFSLPWFTIMECGRIGHTTLLEMLEPAACNRHQPDAKSQTQAVFFLLFCCLFFFPSSHCSAGGFFESRLTLAADGHDDVDILKSQSGFSSPSTLTVSREPESLCLI